LVLAPAPLIELGLVIEVVGEAPPGLEVAVEGAVVTSTLP
jgi:hypothetical protein